MVLTICWTKWALICPPNSAAIPLTCVNRQPNLIALIGLVFGPNTGRLAMYERPEREPIFDFRSISEETVTYDRLPVFSC